MPIADTDNVGIVYDRLMLLGGDLVVKTVDAILAGNVKTTPQEELAKVDELRPAPKIFKDTCRIDWTKELNLSMTLSGDCLLIRPLGRNFLRERLHLSC